MPFHVTYNEADAVVECLYEPPYTPDEYGAAIAENLRVAAEHGALLFFGDCRQLPGAASMFDVYAIVQALDAAPTDSRMREALVIPPDPRAKEAFGFFVTATSNRGLKAAVFTDEDEARQWLKDQAEEIRTGRRPTHK